MEASRKFGVPNNARVTTWLMLASHEFAMQHKAEQKKKEKKSGKTNKK